MDWNCLCFDPLFKSGLQWCLDRLNCLSGFNLLMKKNKYWQTSTAKQSLTQDLTSKSFNGFWNFKLSNQSHETQSKLKSQITIILLKLLFGGDYCNSSLLKSNIQFLSSIFSIDVKFKANSCINFFCLKDCWTFSWMLYSLYVSGNHQKIIETFERSLTD